MKLSNVIKISNSHLVSGPQERLIESIDIDSRNVTEGSIFVCLCEEPEKSTLHVKDAIARGARIIALNNKQRFNDEISVIYVESPREFLARIIRLFYGEIIEKLSVTGITGTNGKTSVSYMLASITNGYYIGTLGIGYANGLHKTGFTTPEALNIFKHLEKLEEQPRTLFIECSSHALAQNRLSGLPIHVAIWTNLTHDHLDYHRTVEEYFKAKESLFYTPTLKLAIINLDCLYGRQIFKKLQNTEVKALSYSLHDNANAWCREIYLNKKGIRLSMILDHQQCDLQSNLIGEFNASNILAIALWLYKHNNSIETIVEKISNLKPVDGRMELICQTPDVFLDFAHTPDALEKALLALRSQFEGTLWCVFGCGGDRDRDKRPLMGQVASTLADKLVITSDNPRGEDPKCIIDDILQGVDTKSAVRCLVDRKEALRFVMSQAKKEDRVLIAGKGHETTQEFADEIITFSDKEEIFSLSKQ